MDLLQLGLETLFIRIYHTFWFNGRVEQASIKHKDVARI